MYRYIKASFDNDIPNWLKSDKRALSALNNAGVDLKNATFSKDRAGKIKDNYVVYYVGGTVDRDRTHPFVWIPGLYNDDNYVAVRDYERKGWNPETGRQEWGAPVDKAIKYVPKKSLKIIDTIYINKASNAKQANPDKYQDPRAFGKSSKYRYAGGPEGKYAGQYYKEPTTTWQGEEVPGQWVTPSGRDKSGYEIPDPRKRLHEFYNTEAGANRRVAKLRTQLDGIYAQLRTLKSRLATLTPKGDDLGRHEAYRSLGRAYDYFGDAVQYYNDALDNIKKYEDKGYEAWGTWGVETAASSLARAQDRIDSVNKITLK